MHGLYSIYIIGQSQVLVRWPRLQGWLFIGKAISDYRPVHGNKLFKQQKNTFNWVAKVLSVGESGDVPSSSLLLFAKVHNAFIFICQSLFHKVFVEALWEWNPGSPPARTEQPTAVAGVKQCLHRLEELEVAPGWEPQRAIQSQTEPERENERPRESQRESHFLSMWLFVANV